MTRQWHAAADAQAQVARLAEAIAGTLARVIDEQGSACLAVSGGRSPIALFAALRVLPLRWADVSITLVDERAVPPEHADSNARLVREHLLQDGAAAARFFPLVLSAHVHGDSVDVDACVATANDPFQQPDVVILGMGDDGHTASLFPDAAELDEGIDRKHAPAYLPVRPAAVVPVDHGAGQAHGIRRGCAGRGATRAAGELRHSSAGGTARCLLDCMR